MLTQPLRRFAPAALCAALLPLAHAQDTRPTSEAAATSPRTTISVDANLVLVPAVIYDKKGFVTTLTQSDFALTVDGKPQPIRYFDRDTDLPLTVGLLVDTSRSQTTVLDEEQKASQKFLDSFLHPSAANHPADKAFVLQFAHSAELLQDVTDSHSLLAAGLKEIGTQAPESANDDKDITQSADNRNTPTNNNPGNTNPNNNGGYGPYGRRGGYPGSSNPNGGGNNGGSSGHSERASGGTVLYDSLFLASSDVLARQNGRRALVVLTDGVDRHSKESLTEAIEAAQRADTVVYAIYYKGREESRGFGPQPGYGGGGYGGYDPYGRYPPTTGGSTDPGTYRDPDGKKILNRICTETGGRMFEAKGKGSVDAIYKQIGEELRAGYRLGFTPGMDAATGGFHAIELTLTNPANNKFDIQTRNGYYTGTPKAH